VPYFAPGRSRATPNPRLRRRKLVSWPDQRGTGHSSPVGLHVRRRSVAQHRAIRLGRSPPDAQATAHVHGGRLCRQCVDIGAVDLQDGKHLYCGNRGPDSIAVWSVDAKGLVTRIADVSTEGGTPRSLALDPSGQFLYSMNQRSYMLTTFRIDPRTGIPHSRAVPSRWVRRPLCCFCPSNQPLAAAIASSVV